jgi:heme-degrading monooxygenase HmoA
MHYVLVKHKVKDYGKWKSIYDENITNREDSGSKGAHVLRGVEDPNEVVILFEWDNLDNARKFFESSNLRMRLQNAGVMDKPEVYFLEGIGRTSA